MRRRRQRRDPPRRRLRTSRSSSAPSDPRTTRMPTRSASGPKTVLRSPLRSRPANTRSRSPTSPPCTTSISTRGTPGSTWPLMSQARVRRRPSSCSGTGVVHLRLRRAPGHDERDLQHPRSDTDAELERQNPALVLSRITSRSGRHRSQRLEGGGTHVSLACPSARRRPDRPRRLRHAGDVRVCGTRLEAADQAGQPARHSQDAHKRLHDLERLHRQLGQLPATASGCGATRPS